MKRFLLIVFILCSLFLPSFAYAQPFEMSNLLTGKKAADFSLKTLGGQEVRMSQYRAGNSAIIFFWATWCPNCHEKLAELNKAAAELKNKGIVVLLVDVEENAKVVNSYVKRNQVPYEIFLDEDSKVAEAYKIIGIPTLFFVGKDGIIKSVEHSIPDNYQEILLNNGK